VAAGGRRWPVAASSGEVATRLPQVGHVQALLKENKLSYVSYIDSYVRSMYLNPGSCR